MFLFIRPENAPEKHRFLDVFRKYKKGIFDMKGKITKLIFNPLHANVPFYTPCKYQKSYRRVSEPSRTSKMELFAKIING